jgi:hypothetical protein
MKTNTEKKDISTLAKNILRTLAYYDIFHYPLTKEEIYFNSNTNGFSRDDVNAEIELLCDQGLIQSRNEFYLFNSNNKLISRRIKGNERAVKKMKTARRISQFIAHFPYIRAIFLSGSISKGFMDDDADIDYLIVTEPNRLWFARFLLVFFKKVFLFNSYKIFCINFFIDSKCMEIEERNIYTATELATLVPTYGSDIYLKFYNANNWIKTFIPNFPQRDISDVPKMKRKIFQKIIESLFNNRLGNYLDNYAMNLFANYDKRRYGNLNKDVYEVAFKTRKNISKHHPNYYQKRVLDLLNEKLEQLETQHNIILT